MRFVLDTINTSEDHHWLQMEQYLTLLIWLVHNMSRSQFYFGLWTFCLTALFGGNIRQSYDDNLQVLGLSLVFEFQIHCSGRFPSLMICQLCGDCHYDFFESKTMLLTHWGRDKMDAISQTTFWIAFSWRKIFEFQFKFHWSLFLRVQLTIFQHWFR